MMARLLVLGCLTMLASGCWGARIQQADWRGDPVRRLIRNQLVGDNLNDPELYLGPEIHFPDNESKRYYLHLKSSYPIIDSESELVIEVDGRRQSLPVDTDLWTDGGSGMRSEARFESSESFLVTMAHAREIVVFFEDYRKFFGPKGLEEFSGFVLAHVDGGLP